MTPTGSGKGDIQVQDMITVGAAPVEEGESGNSSFSEATDEDNLVDEGLEEDSFDEESIKMDED